MAEGFDDYEMRDLGKKYHEYDNMTNDELHAQYNLLNEKHLDTLLDRTTQLNDHDDIKKRKKYIGSLLSKRQEETSFTDDDGKTATIRTKKTTTTAPSVEFDDHYENVSDEYYKLAFNKSDDIERRLNSLKELNKEIAKNQVKRVIMINKKIKKLYKKKVRHQ